MQEAKFAARCPFEIGDVIQIAGHDHTVTEIATIHYIKSGQVEFKLQIDNSRWVPAPGNVAYRSVTVS